MEKIIKFGFLPIKNDRIRGQNDIKGQNIFRSGHVLNVVETENTNKQVTITCSVVAQTSISNVYNVKIHLDNKRNITSAKCTCKAGLSEKCKHVCALVHFINSPQSSDTKTNYSQAWGKPSHRQLLGYDKGARMKSLFPLPPLSRNSNKLQPCKISSKHLEEFLSNTPLQTMLKYEEKKEKEIIAAESYFLQSTNKICSKINLLNVTALYVIK